MNKKVFGIELAFPNIGKSTKNVAKAFWAAAKKFPLHAALCIISLAAIIAYGFGANIWLDGAAAVLFVYTFMNVLKLNATRLYINKLESILDKHNIDKNASN